MGERDRVPVGWEPGEEAARELLSGLDEGEKVFLYRKYVDPKGKTHWSVEGDVDRMDEERFGQPFGYHDPCRGGITDLDGAVYFVTTVKSDHYQRVV